jgi:hypothetical protein
MTWPTIFFSLAGGNQSLALFDAMFNQVAQMVAIPCTAAGTNAITLTPIGNAPALTSYQNFSSFRFVAVATSTTPVTAQYQSLASLPVYLADGLTQASTGAVVIGQEYLLVFAQFLNGGVGGFFLERAGGTAGVFFVPNVQVFLSGTAATYTTPTAAGNLPLYLRVRMSGGGGGGGAASANPGGNGGDTSFAGWTALHGVGGINSGGAGGIGGTGGVNGAGTQITRIAGGNGASGSQPSAGNTAGGDGGNGFFGGGAGGPSPSTAGVAAAPNSGGGGSGGVQGGTGNGGGGGGAGEFVEFIITTPAGSYTYTVGPGGAGGAAGAFAGGAGAAGRIEVEAYWQ